MSKATEFYRGLSDAIQGAIQRVTPFRALVHGKSDGKIKIQPLDGSGPLDEPYARLEGFKLNEGDEVAVIYLNGKPFVLGRVQRTEPAAHSFDHPILVESESNSAFRVAKADGTGIFHVDNLAPSNVGVLNGVHLSGYPNEGTVHSTSKWNLDSSSGNARFDGNVTIGGTATIDGMTANRASLTNPDATIYWQANSDVGSTTNTSTFQTAITRSIGLGSGTYDVTVLGGSMLRHSAGQGIAYRIVTGSQTGNTLIQTFYGDSYTYGIVGHNATGQTGTITVRYEYRSNAAGTSTSKAPWLLVFTRRTG